MRDGEAAPEWLGNIVRNAMRAAMESLNAELATAGGERLRIEAMMMVASGLIGIGYSAACEDPNVPDPLPFDECMAKLTRAARLTFESVRAKPDA